MWVGVERQKWSFRATCSVLLVRGLEMGRVLMLSSGSDSVPVSIIEYPKGTCECEQPAGTWSSTVREGSIPKRPRNWHMKVTDVSSQMTYNGVQYLRQLQWVGPAKEGLNACLLSRVRPLTKVIIGNASDFLRYRELLIPLPHAKRITG
jgi:hypothetical protein